jgi:hypothetical protein
MKHQHLKTVKLLGQGGWGMLLCSIDALAYPPLVVYLIGTATFVVSCGTCAPTTFTKPDLFAAGGFFTLAWTLPNMFWIFLASSAAFPTKVIGKAKDRKVSNLQSNDNPKILKALN